MSKGYVTLEKERRRLQQIFVVPLALSIIVLVLVPIISLFGISFTSLNLSKKDTSIIGLESYLNLLTDASFINAVKNTIIMLVGSVSLQMILGIIIALVIHKTKFLNGFTRTLILLPMIMPPIIVGIMWRIMLMPKYGGFNIMLQKLGVENPPDWLGEPGLAMLTIIMAAVWEWTPFVVLFVLAALEGLPSSPYEAIKIDGANWFQEIWHLTLPLIKPIIGVVVVFRIIEGLKIFPLVFSLTEGGPGSSTEEITFYVYKQGFSYLRLGYASAAAMLVFGTLFLAIFLVMKLGKKKAKSLS